MHSLPRPTRRSLLAASMGAIAAAAISWAPDLHAQDIFPSRPIKIVVGAGAGGSSDITARLVGQQLSTLLGQPVLIENKGGAAGTLSMQHVVRSPPDGHTLVWVGNSVMTMAPYLYKNPGYDVKTLVPVSLAVTSSFVLVASPTLGANNLKEMIAHAKANPGKLSFGSSGVNSSMHLLGELFKTEAGFDALHIPYKGGAESANAIMGGNIHFVFDALSSELPLIHSGKLKALAVTSPMRDKSLPDVPTMAELGLPAMTTEVFFGLVAPPGTPEPIVARLAEAMKQALSDPGLRERLEKSGTKPQSSTPQEFRALVDKEGARFQALIKAKGIAAE
ncbi:MAG: tripartite tricarboxylate transporter substrate binding protein [Sulfuricaulis sp.]|nr:tripartite tricarboxylate transporter substrate binding protein [Sulfuricaulis sp.]